MRSTPVMPCNWLSTIKLWDPSTGKRRATLEGHTAWVYRVAFSPDGRRLASVSDDMTVRLWGVSRMKEVHVYRGHEGTYLRSLAFSPDGRFLTTADMGLTNQFKVWDLSHGPQEYTTLNHRHAEIVGGLAFAADGHRLASASRDRTVKLWDTADGRLLRTLDGHTREVTCVAFGSADQLLASGSLEPIRITPQRGRR